MKLYRLPEIKSQKLKAIILFLVFVLLISLLYNVAYYFAYKHAEELSTLNYYQCPSALKTDEERNTAITDFNNRLLEMNPKATLDDFIEARINFYIGYNCTDMLEKYGYDGTSTIDATEKANLMHNMTTFLKSGNTAS
jgi:hypothetical protein